MIRIELLRDYRGIKINDELWLKGIYEVEDDLGNYLIGKSYARASDAPLPQPPAVEPPDANAVHNEAMKDLDLPSVLEKKHMVTIDTYVDDSGEKKDYIDYSRDELIEITTTRGIKVEGTGTAGYITMQDLRVALEDQD